MTTHSFTDKHFSLLYAVGVLLGLALSILYAEQQIIDPDQGQMIYKGYLGAYYGDWLSYGNFASTVGNLPGYLSAWVVGLPVMLWDSIWSPMLFLIALRLASFFIIDSVLKQCFDTQTRLVFLVFYWLSPWLLFDTLLYNPAYLCFFSALHFWTAMKMREQKSFFYSFIHVLSIGLALQLHFSWPVLALISMYLFYRNMGKVSWFGVFAAIAVVGASLIPYFIEVSQNEKLLIESDRYIGYGLTHVYPVLKSVLYWIRYGSFLFSNKVIAHSSFDWVSSIEWVQIAISYLWKAIVFTIGGLSVLVSAKLNWKAWKYVKPMIKRGEEVTDNHSWVMLYSFGAFVAVVISACLAPITFSYWHLIIALPFALIPILHGISQWKENNSRRFGQVMLIIIGYLFLANIVAASDSVKFSYKGSLVEQNHQWLIDYELIEK